MPPHLVADIVMGLIFGGTLIFIMYSPIGRAIGDRIRYGRLRHPGPTPDEGRMDDISGEVHALRQQLYETQERLDFAERMIAQQKGQGQLPAGH